MKRISNISHSPDIWILCFARLFERAAYYGFRSIVAYFFIENILGETKNESLVFYGWFTSAVYIAYLLGGLIGDLLLKSRRAILFGGIIQAVGMALFYFTHEKLIFYHLGFIAFGVGLYSPSILSLFSQKYKSKSDLIVSGYTLFYLFVNLGATIGIILVGYIYHKCGFGAGFISASILAILGALLPLFLKEDKIEINQSARPIHPLAPLKIIAIIVISALFWLAYENASSHIIEVVVNISRSMDSKFLTRNLTELPLLAFIPLSIGIFFFLRYFYLRSSLLISAGFLFVAASMALLMFVPENANSSHIPVYAFYLILFAFAEILIVPSILSVISKNSNPKYLGIIFGAYLLSGAILNKTLSSIYYLLLGSDDQPPLIYNIICLLVIGGGLFVYFYATNKRKKDISHFQNNNN